MPEIYEIGTVKVVGGKIRFGEATTFYRGSAHRLSSFVTDTAHETNLGISLLMLNIIADRFIRC